MKRIFAMLMACLMMAGCLGGCTQRSAVPEIDPAPPVKEQPEELPEF